MSKPFLAQSLVETRTADRRFEMTFVDATGAKQTISLTNGLAAELGPVLALLAAKLGDRAGPALTKMPKQWAVGHARHERLVLIRFDDEPAYGLSFTEAASLWREVRSQAEMICRMKAPMRQ
jgi:hypothetical protein